MKQQLDEIGNRVRALLTSDATTADLHPGYLREAVLAYPARTGKALRPALYLWCCALFRTPPSAADRIAAAIELYHIWTLVHDDIIDQDDTRRGGPAAHVHVARRVAEDNLADQDRARKFGEHIAILAGDIQQAWANRLILEAIDAGIPPAIGLSILKRLNGYVNPMLICGEALDVSFELMPPATVSITQIAEMLRGKTGILLRFAAEAGAMTGLEVDDVEHPQVANLGDFAEQVGLAFQLRDDVLGLYGDEDKLGKPIGSDVCQGKPTMLYAEALDRTTAGNHQFLADTLGRQDLSAADLTRVRELVRSSGACDAIQNRIDTGIAEAGQKLLQTPQSDARDLLHAWADYAGTRDR
jgi:geranylgeranyl diphosphate synthase type I